MSNEGFSPAMSVSSTVWALEPVWRQNLRHHHSEPIGALRDLSLPEPGAVFVSKCYCLVNFSDLTPSPSARSLFVALTGGISHYPLE